jgi:hypothetical protein
MRRSIRLSPDLQIGPFIGDGEIVAFNIGPDGVIYLVVALRPLDYRTEQPGRASFAKTVPAQPQRYRIIGFSESAPVLDLVIDNERFNIHHIQPLNDELLLVCARSHFKSRNNFEKNGRIYTRDGIFTREILLGDGIQSVQSTADGIIWTSYFDEGVFGNFGWHTPVGASGLVAWDATGNKVYEFEPAAGLDSICDCYAMNVESDNDVWCYYYTEFPLVKLHRRKIASIWKLPLGGSDGFAIGRGYALFRGGYRDRDVYRLFSLKQGGTAKLKSELVLCDENGSKLVADWLAARGDRICFISNGSLYHVDVPAVISS